MEKDKKLTLLELFYEQSIKMPQAYMWLAVPSGIITGRPIEPEEYVQILYGGQPVPSLTQNQEEENQKRFFHLKDVHIVQGKNHNIFNVAIVDGLDVTAWGFFDPTTSTSSSK